MGRKVRCPVCYGMIMAVVDGGEGVVCATRCRKCGAWLLIVIDDELKKAEEIHEQ